MRLLAALLAGCTARAPAPPLSNSRMGLGPELPTRALWWRDSCAERGLVAVCETSVFERYQLICGCVRRRR